MKAEFLAFLIVLGTFVVLGVMELTVSEPEFRPAGDKKQFPQLVYNVRGNVTVARNDILSQEVFVEGVLTIERTTIKRPTKFVVRGVLRMNVVELQAPVVIEASSGSVVLSRVSGRKEAKIVVMAGKANVVLSDVSLSPPVGSPKPDSSTSPPLLLSAEWSEIATFNCSNVELRVRNSTAVIYGATGHLVADVKGSKLEVRKANLTSLEVSAESSVVTLAELRTEVLYVRADGSEFNAENVTANELRGDVLKLIDKVSYGGLFVRGDAILSGYIGQIIAVDANLSVESLVGSVVAYNSSISAYNSTIEYFYVRGGSVWLDRCMVGGEFYAEGVELVGANATSLEVARLVLRDVRNLTLVGSEVEAEEARLENIDEIDGRQSLLMGVELPAIAVSSTGARIYLYSESAILLGAKNVTVQVRGDCQIGAIQSDAVIRGTGSLKILSAGSKLAIVDSFLEQLSLEAHDSSIAVENIMVSGLSASLDGSNITIDKADAGKLSIDGRGFVTVKGSRVDEMVLGGDGIVVDGVVIGGKPPKKRKPAGLWARLRDGGEALIRNVQLRPAGYYYYYFTLEGKVSNLTVCGVDVQGGYRTDCDIRVQSPEELWGTANVSIINVSEPGLEVEAERANELIIESSRIRSLSATLTSGVEVSGSSVKWLRVEGFRKLKVSDARVENPPAILFTRPAVIDFRNFYLGDGRIVGVFRGKGVTVDGAVLAVIVNSANVKVTNARRLVVYNSSDVLVEGFHVEDCVVGLSEDVRVICGVVDGVNLSWVSNSVIVAFRAGMLRIVFSSNVRVKVSAAVLGEILVSRSSDVSISGTHLLLSRLVVVESVRVSLRGVRVSAIRRWVVLDSYEYHLVDAILIEDSRWILVSRCVVEQGAKGVVVESSAHVYIVGCHIQCSEQAVSVRDSEDVQLIGNNVLGGGVEASNSTVLSRGNFGYGDRESPIPYLLRIPVFSSLMLALCGVLFFVLLVSNYTDKRAIVEGGMALKRKSGLFAIISFIVLLATLLTSGVIAALALALNFEYALIVACGLVFGTTFVEAATLIPRAVSRQIATRGGGGGVGLLAQEVLFTESGMLVVGDGATFVDLRPADVSIREYRNSVVVRVSRKGSPVTAIALEKHVGKSFRSAIDHIRKVCKEVDIREETDKEIALSRTRLWAGVFAIPLIPLVISLSIFNFLPEIVASRLYETIWHYYILFWQMALALFQALLAVTPILMESFPFVSLRRVIEADSGSSRKR